MNNYRVLTVVTIIILFVVISGTIYYLNIVGKNPENDNNKPNPDGEPNSDIFDGYNLFVLQKKGQENNSKSLTLLITDMEGKVIIEKDYLKKPRGLDVYPVELFNATTVLLGADDGAVLWNFVTNTTFDLGFSGHHDLEYNANNDSFFTMSWYSINLTGIDMNIYGFDRINEYDWQGRLQWSLDTREFIFPRMWCPLQDSYGKTRDLTHGNTVFYDSEEDVVYYLSRNCNTFFKIDHKTKEVLWALGEYGDFQLFDQQGSPKKNLFFHAHSVEKIDTNTFILFDNDKHNQTNPVNFRSRIVEITVNETSMTANESWVWTAPVEYYTDIWGDADRLPNGNRLGTFGTQTHPDTNIGPRLVEVNDSGEIVWEMDFLTTDDYMYGIYSMERFRFTPSISSPADVWALVIDNVTVNWQTWYNFRAKQRMQGSYMVYLNDTLIESELHVFEKWWLPSDLTVRLDNLPPGAYNMTVVLADEVENTIRDSVTIHVSTSFHIVRNDPTSFEVNTERSKKRHFP